MKKLVANVRRSARLMQTTTTTSPPTIKMPEPIQIPSYMHPSKTKATKKVVCYSDELFPASTIDLNSIAPRCSTKEISIALTDFHEKLLGHQLLPNGKYTVMRAITNHHRHIPVFNKMSGIVSMKNALVLFVNIKADAEHPNIFNYIDPTHVFMEWFAQSKQTNESEPLVRLVNGETVLLFVRQENLPYVYLGRLTYVEHFADESPIRFRFQLQDSVSFKWERLQLQFGEKVFTMLN